MTRPRPPLGTFALYEGIDRPHWGPRIVLGALDLFGLAMIVGWLLK